MKTCVKCGKNVADSTTMCPNCHSLAFHTDQGMEGGSTLLFDLLLEKAPKVGIVILSIIGIAVIAFAIWLFTLPYR